MGTDIGVLASGNQGVTWEVMGDNMPAVVVPDLYIHEATQHLYAGTYGRSSYKLDLSAVVLGNSTSALDHKAALYPNPATDFVTIEVPKSISETKILIYDQLGRTMYQQEYSNSMVTFQIAIDTIPSGVYFVKIIQGKYQCSKRLIIK